MFFFLGIRFATSRTILGQIPLIGINFPNSHHHHYGYVNCFIFLLLNYFAYTEKIQNIWINSEYTQNKCAEKIFSWNKKILLKFIKILELKLVNWLYNVNNILNEVIFIIILFTCVERQAFLKKILFFFFGTPIS